MAIFTLETTFTTITCYKCGLIFGVPNHWDKERREDRATFFCPNGHAQMYSCESKSERLNKELQQERQKLDQEKARAADLQRMLDDADKQAKRTAKRIHRGVCPCCNRSFENVRRHMQTKHPEYSKTKESK